MSAPYDDHVGATFEFAGAALATFQYIKDVAQHGRHDTRTPEQRLQRIIAAADEMLTMRAKQKKLAEVDERR